MDMPMEELPEDPSRSYEKINEGDLEILAEQARNDREQFFLRRPRLGELYKGRIICVALCQGAAAHYVDPQRGVKDFDVWTFFAAHPEAPIPPRRIGRGDFGPSKFGRDPRETSGLGRRIDFLMRSIRCVQRDPVPALHEYLSNGKTRTAQLLALKAVVLIEPASLRGTVVWAMGEAVNFRPQE
jgi:hypothetical protein